MLSLSGLFQALLFLAGIIAVNSSTYVSVVYSPVIVIAVESERYDDLEDSIKTFRNDLTVDGWVTDLRLIKNSIKPRVCINFWITFIASDRYTEPFWWEISLIIRMAMV